MSFIRETRVVPTNKPASQKTGSSDPNRPPTLRINPANDLNL